MSEKKYIVVTNARREVVSSSIYHAERAKTNYRTGEIALLHPAVLDFVKGMKEWGLESRERHRESIGETPEVVPEGEQRLNREQKKRLFEYLNNLPLESFKVVFPATHPYSDFDLRDEKSVVALSHHNFMGKERYFYMGLYEGEFVRLNSLDLDGLVKEIGDVFLNNNIKWSEVREHVENSWRPLESFDILAKHKLDEIPFELSCRHISDDLVEAKNKFLKSMAEIDRTSYRPYRPGWP